MAEADSRLGVMVERDSNSIIKLLIQPQRWSEIGISLQRDDPPGVRLACNIDVMCTIDGLIPSVGR